MSLGVSEEKDYIVFGYDIYWSCHGTILSLENYIKLYTMKQSLRHMSSIQHIIKKQWCDTNHMVVDDISEG